MTRTSSALFALLLAYSGVAFGQACTPPDATITFAGSASDGYVCGGQSLTAQVPDAGPGATYAWSLAGDSPQASITSGQGTRTVTVLSKNLPYLGYRNWTSVLQVTVTNGCAAKSGEQAFNAIPIQELYDVSIDPPTIAIGTGPMGCAKREYHASIAFRGQFLVPPERTYQWQVENGTILANHGTSIDFQAGSASSPLQWSVITQDRCSAPGVYHGHSGSFELADAIDPSPTLIAPASVRPNSPNNAVYLSNWHGFLASPRMYLFDWTVVNGTLQGQSSIPGVFTAGASGNVTVTATIVDYCGHTYLPSATIPIGEPPVTLTAPDHLCGNEAGMAAVNPIAGATYTWSLAGGMIAAGQGTPSITFMPIGGSPVFVGVSVDASYASKSIDVFPVPETTITTPSPVASHSTMTASIPDAGPGATYAWSITNGSFVGPSDQPAIKYVAGEHGSVKLDVSVTSASGCTAADSLKIAVAADKRRAVRH